MQTTTPQKVIEILNQKYPHINTRTLWFRNNSKLWKSSPDYAEKIADCIAKFWNFSNTRIQLRGPKARNNRNCFSEADSSQNRRNTEDADNIVIACSTCNTLRGRTTFDAYQFYDWAQAHLDIIKDIADGKIKANRKTMLPYFGKEYCRSGFK